MSNGLIERLDLSQRQKTEAQHVVEPSFIVGDIRYYDEVPNFPEKSPPQVVLPMSLVEDWVKSSNEEYNLSETDPKKHKKIGFSYLSNKKSFEKPGVGAFVHAAVINIDPEGNFISFAYDINVFKDGPIDTRNNLATPGSVVAPIEKIGDEYYARCFWEYRPVIWDNEKVIPEDINDPEELEKYLAVNRGEWVLSVPGGYAKVAKQSGSEVASEEASEEGGVFISKPIFVDKTFNRSNQETKTHIGYSMVSGEGTRHSGRDERIYGSFAVNVKAFGSSDAMSQAAVDFALRDLLFNNK